MKLILKVIALLCLTAGGVAAQEFFPALYRVVGVAADDVLNVRAGPGSEYDAVSALTPDATGIEVVAMDPETGWMMLNVAADDLSGYVSPAYLERLPGDDMRAFPMPLFCGGTEPFWGLQLQADGTATYHDFEDAERDFSMDWHGPATARMGDEFGAALTSGGDSIHAVLQRNECSDGMSDYAFGLKIDALVNVRGQRFMLTGCCSIRR